MTDITIYTDGSARGNPNGPGGYGALVRYRDASGKVYEREYSAGYAVTTNNRMELMAVIVALENLKHPCRVRLYSDSKYVTDAYNEGWIYYWKSHGYRNKNGDAVKNRELWERLAEQTERHEVTFEWVKGHNGHPENERCDNLATSAADGDSLLLDDGGDLREEVPAPADPVRKQSDAAGAETNLAEGQKNGTASGEEDRIAAALAGRLSKEELRELIETLQRKIDAEMELLEQLEERFYAG